MKEIFSVNSDRANGKKMPLKKKNSMTWAKSKEVGPKARPKAGQGRGKLVSVDWLTKSSPGLPPGIKREPPSLYHRGHICLPKFNYGFLKGKGPMLKTKEKKTSFECVHDLS